MNYLAHITLSGNDEFIKLGNFIADSVKGNKYQNFPMHVKIGILLHRQIDWFTDKDETFIISKRRLHTRYGHYKGVIIDIFYDHFLAKNWKSYSDIVLSEFAQEFYSSLEDNFNILPEKVKYLVPHMKEQDWLTNYANLEGIERVLIGMNRRTKGISQMDLAIHDLKEHYLDFEKDFSVFFKKLRNFSAKKLVALNKEFDIT